MRLCSINLCIGEGIDDNDDDKDNEDDDMLIFIFSSLTCPVLMGIFKVFAIILLWLILAISSQFTLVGLWCCCLGRDT